MGLMLGWMILPTNHCYVMLQLIGELYGAMFRRRRLTDVIGQQKYIENNRSKNNGKDIRVDDLTDQSLLGYNYRILLLALEVILEKE